jgi:Amt family ammonium transporter
VGLFAEPTRVAARCLAPANNWKGLFYGGGVDQLLGQGVGIVATALYVLVISSAAWLVLKYTVGIRVSAQEEMDGLDLGEHGMYAYPAALVTESIGVGPTIVSPQASVGGVAQPSVGGVG